MNCEETNILSFSNEVIINETGLNTRYNPKRKRRLFQRRLNEEHIALNVLNNDNSETLANYNETAPSRTFDTNINLNVVIKPREPEESEEETCDCSAVCCCCDFICEKTKFCISNLPFVGGILKGFYVLLSFLYVLIALFLADFLVLRSNHPKSDYLAQGMRCMRVIYAIIIVNFTILYKYRTFKFLIFLLTFIVVLILSMHIFKISIVFRLCSAALSVKRSIEEALRDIFGFGWFGRKMIGWADDMMDVDWLNECDVIVNKVID